jgi:hypothetical protein
MEFFTLLTIVYLMGGQTLEAKILFASEDDCWQVLLDTDTIYDQINGQAGFCEVSHIPSYIVKPKLRPQ